MSDTATTTPTPDPAPKDADERFDRFELLVAVLLGIAAILTAWAAFQGSLLGGDSQKELTKAALSSDQAGQWWSQGNQRLINDQGLFREFVKASQEGNTDFAEYMTASLMDENLQNAVAWWGDVEDDDVLSPFEEAEGNPYTIDEFDEGERLDAKSAKELKEGEALDDRGDKYDGVTVLLAISLFLFGIAALMKGRWVRIGVVAFGTIVLVISAARLVDLGVYQWTA